MSKEIFLYSADNKYQAYVELADNTDRFGCPDHSFFKLIENRNDDKLYLIAEARDGLLETEKDQRIAELKQDLEFTTKTANELIEIKHKLEQELAELKEKPIVVPVKLGDTIYVIPSETNYRLNIVNRREDRNKVYKYLVDEIRYNKYGFSIVCDVGDVQFYCNYEPPKNLCGHFDTEKYYGETWFTTEQEAQEKLKEMKRNG